MEQTQPKYGIWSSSIDPSQLSATVLAATKTLSGLLVFWGMLSAADGTTLFTHVNAIVTNVAVIAPLAFAMWHSAEIIFGLLQKALVKFTQKTSSAASVTVSPTA